MPDWAAIPKDRLRLVHGDQEIAEGIRLLSTPGHTPGHQSVVIEAGDERVLLAAQCAYRAEELRSGQPASSNLHDESWADAARDSLQRLRALAPFIAHLSHDPEIVTLVQ
ncbi:MAG TPA: MBL fold metallo-hydrolase [Acidimicrobiales bacterium]|nr:MBL fold metallo-hydrolase [Acidimicrobiales bacterium]